MKILVVDDSPAIRKIICRELDAAGYSLCEAENGKAALKVLHEQPDIDLVTLDVEMPEMTGFQVLEAIRNKGTDSGPGSWAIPAILVTSRDTVEDRVKGFQLGAVDFIVKPFARGELKTVVDGILRSTGELAGLHVLIVEQSQACRLILTSCLKQLGVTVHVAENGNEAYEHVKAHFREIDMVITELECGGISGMELCTKIRRELARKDMPILVLTDMGSRESPMALFKSGASDCLTKPFLKEEIEARLRAHLEQQRLNRKLKRNIEELKALSLLKDRFLGVCSHDLKAPISAIRGACDVLNMGDMSPEDVRNMLGIIDSSGATLLALVNEILDAGRTSASFITPTDMTPISLTDVIASCTRTLSQAASNKGVNLVVENSVGEVKILGVRTPLVRIFNNLLSNAIKFTRPKGHVLVKVECPDAQHVHVTVADSGIGIPPESLDILFDRYTQVSRPGTSGEKGTGLGLSITKDLVESHKGIIVVESKVGEGTNFIVQFPLASNA